jgi:predicted TIM-barrel fold metal-dependent hydrolase
MGGSPKEPSAATRYGNIKFIWSHAGGALLGVVSRVVGTVSAADLAGTPNPNSKLYHVRRFYYDTAGSANPIAMQGLKTLAGSSQIVFGTECPVRHVRCHRTGSGGVWAQQGGTPSHKPRKRIKNIAEIFVSS